MKVIRGIDKFRMPKGFVSSAVCIGTFDGVHLAHSQVIRKTVALAKRKKILSMVVTFYPHPLEVTSPQSRPCMLTGLDHRLRLIEKLGADVCLVVNFKSSFAGITPEYFAEKILKKKLKAESVVVGENFRFGKGKSAGADDLKAFGKSFGFKVFRVRELGKDGLVISSSLIRKLVESGDLNTASRMLGRDFSILGTVISGESRGRELGFPTANIDPHQEAIPPEGVYAVKVILREENHKGMLYIGKRPTFKPPTALPTIEINIFDFKRNIYKENLEIFFVEKIRNDRRFSTADRLIAQLKKDESRARKVLENSKH